jgi:hypothetical protein
MPDLVFKPIQLHHLQYRHQNGALYSSFTIFSKKISHLCLFPLQQPHLYINTYIRDIFYFSFCMYLTYSQIYCIHSSFAKFVVYLKNPTIS